MTTPPSTRSSRTPGELAGAPGGTDSPVDAGGPLDLSTLARLANELFVSLPDQGPPGRPPSAPAVPEPVTPVPFAPVPFAGPPPTPTDSAIDTLPQGHPGAGGVRPPAVPVNSPAPAHLSSLTELPTAPGPFPPVLATPDISPSPVAAPSTPYYFLGEAGAFADPNVVPATEPDQLGLPDEAALQALLTVLPGTLGAEKGPAEHPDRYFLRAVPDQPPLADPHPPFDVHAVRRDFPILSERVNGRQLVWLDNAATTQKPRTVIDRLTYYYEHENSNVHRAAHELAARATDAYESARSKVAKFIGAGSATEIVFARGATEAINLVAQSWGRQNIREGDEIVLSHLEHHANIVPWQRLASEKGAVLRVIPVDDRGQVRLDEYQQLLSDRTKLVAVAHVSNALGTITLIHQIVEMGHRAGACVLVDGAQSVSHMPVDVRDIDADFFVFSGHKVFGPTGIGVLYGKAPILAAMPPWQGGGNMISDVTFERSLYLDPPMRFEAGTGNIADAIGLGAALDYLERLGMENVQRYEHELLAYATAAMVDVPGLRLIGTAPDKASVLSFVLDGYAPEEVGQALSRDGIAVRAGHHCAQPILRRFGLEATVRPSLAVYNTTDEVDQMVGVLRRLVADIGGGRR